MAILLDDSGAQRFGWDGSEFRETPIGSLPFITSSSVQSDPVIAARKRRLEQICHLLPLIEILSDTEAEKPEEAIYVTWEDGGTVSQTVVRVNRDEVQFSVTRRGESRQFESIPRRSASDVGLGVNAR